MIYDEQGLSTKQNLQLSKEVNNTLTSIFDKYLNEGMLIEEIGYLTHQQIVCVLSEYTIKDGLAKEKN